MKDASKALYNAKNERIKYKYRNHLKRALRKDAKTVIAILKHIREFEIHTEFKDFSCFNDEVANKYIESLFGRNCSLSYIGENLRYLKEFIRWLERQKGYRSKIDYNHIDYLNISNNQKRTAKAVEYKIAYTYDQIIKTIRNMPDKRAIESRNRAMISLQALCGLRISELRTVKIKNIICEEGSYFIYVNPKDMEVKFAKIRQANFMPLPVDIAENVIKWRDYLLENGFNEKDSLFPQTSNKFNQRNLLESKVEHKEIKANTTIRNVFKKAFAEAGYAYLRPHSFRHTIARFAERQSPEFLNAVRQALGHSSITTTFQSYGELSEYEQRRRIAGQKIDFLIK